MRRNYIPGIFACLIAFIISGSSQSFSQAEKLRAKAVEAGHNGNWNAALDSLHVAYALAGHEDPLVLHDLGVAHDGAGHLIPAVFWLKAYLLANPSANDMVDVIARINTLVDKATEQESSLYRTAIDDEKQLKEPNFYDIARAEAEAGHIEWAFKLNPDANDREDLWLELAAFSKWVGHLDEARNALSKIPLQHLGFRLSEYFDQKDRHGWDGLSRQQLEGRFFGSINRFFGPDSCPEVDLPLVHQTIGYIQDVAYREKVLKDSKDLLDAWDKATPKLTKLNSWLACAETVDKYETEDIASQLTPESLRNASFNDPARIPGVFANIGSRLGVRIARFRSLEHRIDQS